MKRGSIVETCGEGEYVARRGVAILVWAVTDMVCLEDVEEALRRSLVEAVGITARRRLMPAGERTAR
ncbi:hypothetical protein CQ10_34590 [Bradyrhizobium valentinum]|uniref:Uncharacterized protein n=1 Tax=Bradyrhizobium valentinum TaxID=1518501 RepID=A0A0R3LB26_9BRAD|nr:hypothetical protein CQ10_34590 [Bradyrhizobium valentinum]KRR02086.1 hypothetical protein CP49_04705 [Bradyrhizobium valentinum]